MPASAKPRQRGGKALVLLCLLLPSLLAVAALVVDGSALFDMQCRSQHAADAAATAAALELLEGASLSTAEATARDQVLQENNLESAQVSVASPPGHGAFSGRPQHVEVVVRQAPDSYFSRFVAEPQVDQVESRAVAAVLDATDGAAVVALDENPADLSLAGVGQLLSGVSVAETVAAAIPQTGVLDFLEDIPLVGSLASTQLQALLEASLPAVVTELLDTAVADTRIAPLPTLTAGLEIEGLGRLIVDGAVCVNTSWGGVDERNVQVGSAAAPPYGLACMPLLSTTRLMARDICVAGGVDYTQNYLSLDAEDRPPLQANRRPVPDPLADLPVPSQAVEAATVSTTLHEPAHCVRLAVSASDAAALVGALVDLLPLPLRSLLDPVIQDVEALLSTAVLQPGVYDSITVIAPAGGVEFAPGVYVIRSKSPITNMSLCLLGPVQAEGVMFYITPSEAFDAGTGMPDAIVDPQDPPPAPIGSLLPSTLIAPILPGGRLTGLNDPASHFDGMLVCQQRTDRRPIVIESQNLLGGSDLAGVVYSKWGHVLFAGGGASYDLKIVAGTIRFLTLGDTYLSPISKLQPARDVYLLE